MPIDAGELIGRARALAPALAGRARHCEERRCLPPDTVAELREAGVFRVLQPARFGGFELSLSTLINVAAEIGWACGSTAWCVALGALHNRLAGLFDERAQREVFGETGDAQLAVVLRPAGTATVAADASATAWRGAAPAFASRGRGPTRAAAITPAGSPSRPRWSGRRRRRCRTCAASCSRRPTSHRRRLVRRRPARHRQQDSRGGGRLRAGAPRALVSRHCAGDDAGLRGESVAALPPPAHPVAESRRRRRRDRDRARSGGRVPRPATARDGRGDADGIGRAIPPGRLRRSARRSPRPMPRPC